MVSWERRAGRAPSVAGDPRSRWGHSHIGVATPLWGGPTMLGWGRVLEKNMSFSRES